MKSSDVFVAVALSKWICGGHAIARGERPGLVGEKAPEVSKLKKKAKIEFPEEFPEAHTFCAPGDDPINSCFVMAPAKTKISCAVYNYAGKAGLRS